jgi:hypothetical protein
MSLVCQPNVPSRTSKTDASQEAFPEPDEDVDGFNSLTASDQAARQVSACFLFHQPVHLNRATLGRKALTAQFPM